MPRDVSRTFEFNCTAFLQLTLTSQTPFENLSIYYVTISVTFSINLFLFQMEMENQQLKMTNLKQSEQILLLQDKLQSNPTFFLYHSPPVSPFFIYTEFSICNLFTTAVLERPISACSPKPLVVDAQLASTSPLHIPSYFGTSPTHDECGRMTGSCKPGSNTIRGTSLYPQHSILHDTWSCVVMFFLSFSLVMIDLLIWLVPWE